MERFGIYRIDNDGADETCLLADEFNGNLSIYEHIVVANAKHHYIEDCYIAKISKELFNPEKDYYYVFNADGEVMIQPMDIKDGKPVINDKNPTAKYTENEAADIYNVFYGVCKSENWIEQERRLIEADAKNDNENIIHFEEKQGKILRNIANIVSAADNSINFNVINDFAREVIVTLKQKNQDYGNSFLKNIERFGDVAMLMPMFNKLDRLESLTKKDYANFESVSDSIRDLIGYALMSLYYVDIIRVNKNKLKGDENGNLE